MDEEFGSRIPADEQKLTAAIGRTIRHLFDDGAGNSLHLFI